MNAQEKKYTLRTNDTKTKEYLLARDNSVKDVLFAFTLCKKRYAKERNYQYEFTVKELKDINKPNFHRELVN